MTLTAGWTYLWVWCWKSQNQKLMVQKSNSFITNRSHNFGIFIFGFEKIRSTTCTLIRTSAAKFDPIYWAAFNPEPIWSQDFRSPTSCSPGQTIPMKLIPLDEQSPWNWSPWTNGPHKIRSPWTNGPQPIWSSYFCIPTACLSGKTEYSKDHLSRGTKLFGDWIGWEPFVQRDQLNEDQLNEDQFLGIKCPGTICVWDLLHVPRLGTWFLGFWGRFIRVKISSNRVRWIKIRL